MNARKLISLTLALAITGLGTWGLLSAATPAPGTALPASIDGIPVTVMPTVTVRATPLPAAHHRGRSGAAPVRTGMAGAESSFGPGSHKTALRLSLPTLRMPYYSFGSTSLSIGKD